MLVDPFGRPIGKGKHFLAYFSSSVLVRSSIGGLVKSVRVKDVSKSGEMGFRCCGSSSGSWLLSMSKNASTVCGYKKVACVAWCGVC